MFRRFAKKCYVNEISPYHHNAQSLLTSVEQYFQNIESRYIHIEISNIDGFDKP